MPGWYNGNWGFRKKITIQNTNIDGDMTDFPVYVPLSADADFHEAKADGYDIRFTKADGQTLLKYERESWSGGGGGAATADFWVKSNVTTAASIEIYIYYGYASASDGDDKNNVWDSDFEAVWHLNSVWTDSTSNGHTLTPTSAPTGQAGLIADGFDFNDGDPDYATRASTPISAAPFTFESWINSDDNTQTQILVWVGDTATSVDYQETAVAGEALYAVSNGGPPSDEKTAVTTNTLNAGWNYCVTTHLNASNRVAILNADFANKGSDANASTPNNEDGVAIGIGNTNPVQWPVDGMLDECRISSAVRSDNYIKFVNANITEGDNELTFGAEEGQPELDTNELMFGAVF
jgi:hypothetical protein